MRVKAFLGFSITTALLASSGVDSLWAATHYVAPDNPNPVPPYTDWSSAATNIQQAIDVAAPGDEVLVTNGIYATGSRDVGGSTGNRVAVLTPLVLRSVNGPEFTIIDAGGAEARALDPYSTNRCVFLTNGATLCGFTLTNGAADSGAGVLSLFTNAIITNCVIIGNSAQWMGGGAYDGTLNNCRIRSNSAPFGGGVYQSALLNCTLTGNSATEGGGASQSRLNNCVLADNSASTGGGAFGGMLANCTVCRNSAQFGGGVADGAWINCILYFNEAAEQGPNYFYQPFVYWALNRCCTTPQPEQGIGNITDDPTFVDLAGGDLRLQSNSPCIDAGDTFYVVGSEDLAGNPRLSSSKVDLGAYEFQIIAAPVITRQPQGQTVPANSMLTLSVEIRGTLPCCYQWQHQGLDLVEDGRLLGVNTTTFTLNDASGADAGDYTVVVSNAFGTVQSQPASLVVLDPCILTGPTNVSAKLGGSLTLEMTAVGTPPLTYSWRKDGIPLTGESQPLLLLTNLNGAHGGLYDVIVTNAYGSITSAVATVQVDVAVADSFNPGVGGGGNPSVYCLCLQRDGKILVAGSFTTLTGKSRTNLGRLNPDGTLDESFNPQVGGGLYPAINSVVVQPSGDILVGGRFDSLGGLSRPNLGRLHADGTVDTGFNPGASGSVVDFTIPEVNCLALDANGRILVGGTFNSLGGQRHLCLGRLHPDGSLDDTFSPGADYVVQALTVQPDGAILVSGKFSTLAGKPCKNIGRVKEDGTYDDGFNVQVNGGGVMSMAAQPDGKLLLSGTFESLDGESRNGLGRVYPNGNVDLSFNPAVTGVVWCVAQQADGRILAGGQFLPSGEQANNCLVRLNADGTVDAAFTPQVSGTLNPQSTAVVCSLALQDNGKLLVGGSFTNLCDEARGSLGRLLTTGDAIQSLTFNSSLIRWQRSGTGPEVWCSSFQYSTNGMNWSESLPGNRVAGGWQVSGLALPPQAQVRARGQVAGGYGGRSAWFVESSTGGSPRLEGVWSEAAGSSLMFPSQLGLTYSVEYTDDLASGPWQLLEQRSGSGNAETVVDTGSKAAARFYRLRAGWAQP